MFRYRVLIQILSSAKGILRINPSNLWIKHNTTQRRACRLPDLSGSLTPASELCSKNDLKLQSEKLPQM